MNGIDTNVLVRILVNDNKSQAQKATKFIDKEGIVFISDIVICETSWVLMTCYGQNKNELIATIESILSTNQFDIENPDRIRMALVEYKSGSADFSDYLIGSAAVYNHADFVATFDKKAAKSRLFKSLV